MILVVLVVTGVVAAVAVVVAGVVVAAVVVVETDGVAEVQNEYHNLLTLRKEIAN